MLQFIFFFQKLLSIIYFLNLHAEINIICIIEFFKPKSAYSDKYVHPKLHYIVQVIFE